MRALAPFMASLLVAACGSAGGQTAPEIRSPYAFTAVGRIDSAGEARQLAAETDGVIDQVLVARGERVKAGQILLRMRCDVRHNAIGTRTGQWAEASSRAALAREGARAEEIAIAQARMASAEAQHTETAAQFARIEALREAGFATMREIDQRRGARDDALARLAAARAELALLKAGTRGSERAAAEAAARAAAGELGVARAMARQCELRSPIDGQVLQIMRREGEFSGASQGQPLMVVGDLSEIIVRAEINERDAGRIRPGQPVEVWIDGQPTRWRGKVDELAGLMGRRTARSLDPTDRFDRDVREVLINFDGAMPPPVAGLRVTVGVIK